MAKRRGNKSGGNQAQSKRWNSRIHIFLAIGFVLLITIPWLNKTPSEEVSIKASDAAVKFLYLVDNGEYVRSWETSSKHMKAAVTGEEWKQQITEIRDKVGAIVERHRDEVSYLEGAGDLPEGEYVVITYNSVFKKRQLVKETVTLALAKNGEWQVAGYFLK